MASVHTIEVADTGRDGTAVFRGALFGVLLGIGAVAYTRFALPRGKRRDDALFGTWLGTGAQLVLACVIVAVLTVMARDDGPSASRAASADRVVGAWC